MAELDGQFVGTLKFQLEDPEFWPEIQPGTSGYVHRFAVRRRVAGSGISHRMLDWAKEHTRTIGRTVLRLDCVPRPKLCQVYEQNGFIKHSEKQVGPYWVARYEYKMETS